LIAAVNGYTTDEGGKPPAKRPSPDEGAAMACEVLDLLVDGPARRAGREAG
jgi:hypothetical protein